MKTGDVTTLFLAVATLLATARLLGELARRLHQPAVLGEILAGVLLGPTVLGALAPDAQAYLFPRSGAVALALEAIGTLAISLFLLVAGMEVDLSTVWRQGRVALGVGVAGLVVPFALGFGAAWLAPEALGAHEGADRLVFALFVATALGISALPVIAKILIDLNLYRTDLGMIVVAAAIFNDLVGWIVFALVLGLMGAAGHDGGGIGMTIAMTLGFAGGMLTVGRWLVDRVLPFLQAHTVWPGGVLGFALSAALFAAAFTESIGIHAIFGAFLFGVALGDSRHLRERTRATIDQFVSFFFAPLFFASIGLRVDFVARFDVVLVLTVLAIGTVGKVLGAGLGARWSGLPPRQSLAVGFGMNARGAMEIILGLLALEAGLIRERMFVALVVMALVTSVASGSVMQLLLGRKRPIRFTNFLSSRGFVPKLRARERREAIEELVRRVSDTLPGGAEAVSAAVWKRESIMATGLVNGLAVPHARLAGLKAPTIAVGISRGGIDFDAADGQPATLVFLVLTPDEDSAIQLALLSDIGRTFQNRLLSEKATRVANYTQFLALVRAEGAPD